MKWTLSVDVKRTFSEPEEPEQPEPEYPITEAASQDVEKPNLKHNPYVEVDLVRNDTLKAFNRSNSIDDVIETDSRLVDPIGLRMPVLYERSRAHSEPDIHQNAAIVAEALHQSPQPNGSIHGIRLKPLNVVNKLKETKVAAEKADDEDTAKVNTISEDERTLPPSASQEDRNLIAKALGTSACVDPGIQNRTDKLKVFMMHGFPV